jgi:hypothetical protein
LSFAFEALDLERFGCNSVELSRAAWCHCPKAAAADSAARRSLRSSGKFFLQCNGLVAVWPIGLVVVAIQLN